MPILLQKPCQFYFYCLSSMNTEPVDLVTSGGHELSKGTGNAGAQIGCCNCSLAFYLVIL